MKRSMFIIAAGLLSLIASPALATAPQWAPSDRASVRASLPTMALAQRQITAREARSIALARVPGGEVVDISRTGDSYRVRIIARDGRVVDIVVDANTGRVR